MSDEKLVEEFSLVEHMIPSVTNSKLREVKFNPMAIVDSLMEETSISRDDAVSVAFEVIRRIIGSNIKNLTTPLIRELVNSILLSMGLEVNRYQYTRLGIPFYDFSIAIREGEYEKKVVSKLESEFIEVNKIIKSIKRDESGG